MSKYFTQLGCMLCATALVMFVASCNKPVADDASAAPADNTSSSADADHDHDHDHAHDDHDHAHDDHGHAEGDPAHADEHADASDEAASQEEAAGDESAGEASASTLTEGEPAPAAEGEPSGDESADAADSTEESPATVSAGELALAAAVTSAPASEETVTTGDWPMWGGSIDRNMVNRTRPVSIDFEPSDDPAEAKNILWTSKLGSQTYGNPVVANGRVYVGTNNGAEYRPQHKGDKGCVLCFDEKTGEFLWQLTRDKLESGRVNDWPLQGICSSVAVEENRVYVVTNRCELMCLDAEGFHDGENDGAYQDETDSEKEDADIIWSYDMIEELGVFPHNLATSSPVVYQDNVFIVTSNGVDEAHLEIPAPRAPSFISVNKMTGELVWEDGSPEDRILHGQWSSPAIGIVDGQAQVYFPGGDGWLYALDAATGEHIWKFDCNPKDAVYELGGRGTRNEIISTPVFYENTVIVSVGQDPEHGEGIGHMYRIATGKTGDVSAVLDEDGDGQGEPNPNSAQIWHYGGVDEDGSITGKAESFVFRRTISTAAVHDGLVYSADLSGRLHCVDLESGKRYWEADLLSAIWGSPMVADGKVFIGDEDGDLTIFAEGRELKTVRELTFPSSLYSTPVIANGVMYISDRSRLYAIDIQ